MSVPEGKRTESKLAVQSKAKALAAHTVTICSNEKVFPKRERWAVTNRIVSAALTIMEEIDVANDIYVSTKDDFQLRRRSQTVALSHTAKLLGLMELAYVKYGISGQRMEYWTGLVIEVRELAKKWRQSDKERFKKYI